MLTTWAGPGLQAEVEAINKDWVQYRHRGWSGFTIYKQNHMDRRDQFPSVVKLAEEIPGAETRLTLFRLEPGAVVPRHADNDIHVWDQRRDVAGFHIAVATNPGCLMVWWNHGVPRVMHLGAGCLVHHDWAFDHLVVNGGPEPRVHLYVEKPLTDTLWRFIAEKG